MVAFSKIKKTCKKKRSNQSCFILFHLHIFYMTMCSQSVDLSPLNHLWDASWMCSWHLQQLCDAIISIWTKISHTIISGTKNQKVLKVKLASNPRLATFFLIKTSVSVDCSGGWYIWKAAKKTNKHYWRCCTTFSSAYQKCIILQY